MEISNLIYELTEIVGLSASEKPIAEFLCDKLKKLGLDAQIDSFGNVHGLLKSNNLDAKTILLEAHMDQIGLIVSGVDEFGYIKFTNLGGVDERILPGMEVKILSDNQIPGIIGPIPFKKVNGEEKNPKFDEYRIDVGMDKEEAKKCIKIGDFIQLSSKTIGLLNNRMSGAAMDNRAGVASVLTCLEKLAYTQPFYNISVLFSTQEELGLHGAFTGADSNLADLSIVVDVTHGETPDTKEEAGVFPLGSGAIICRGPNLHYGYTKELIRLAREKNVSHEIEVASGSSGTTAWAIQTLEKGIPVMLVSIPLRYMHTNVETLEIADIEAVADLLYFAITGGISIA